MRARSRKDVFTRTVATAFILSALSAFSASSASSQTDPRLVDAIRNAQEGRSDSARMKVRRLLAATVPTDTLYPEILYTQAMVASEADEMRRHLQRVAVEYSTSSWADDALLRLVQLDYASGNLEGAARNLERIRLDYPGSSLLPQASYWAARTYFDQKNTELACRWLSDGLAAARGNIELQNQLGYLDQRCAGVRAVAASRPPGDSQATMAAAGPDTNRRVPHPKAPPSPEPRAATPTTPPAATPATPPPPPPSAPPQPRAAVAVPPTTPAAQPSRTGGRFRLQISAVRSAATAESTVDRLRARGLTVVMVQEAGLYKVRVGDYATRAEAAADQPRIKAQLGGSPFVVAEP